MAQRILVAPIALAALAGCAHAPDGPRPVWPPPPQAPRARWAGELPSPQAGQSPWWKRALQAVVGIEEEARRPLLRRPFGLALDGDDLLVADPDGAQVVRIDRRSGAAEPLRCPGRPWAAPMAVAADPGRARYVADGGAVVRLTPGGPCTAFGEGRLERPTGLAVLAGRIYAVDPPRHDVVAFDLEGVEVLRFGRRGEAAGELNFPTAIAAEAAGTLLVVDALNFRLSRYSADGAFLASFGGPGEEPWAFERPKSVAVGAAGSVYVTDAQKGTVMVFSSRGAFEFAVGHPGSGPGELELPAGVAVGGGRLYVADSLDQRVEVYDLVGDAS